jgi:hypothetical protein
MLYITQHVPSHIYDLLLLLAPKYICWLLLEGGPICKRSRGSNLKYMASTQKKKRKSCSWLLGWLLLYMHDARAFYMLHIKRPAAIVDRGGVKKQVGQERLVYKRQSPACT